MCLLNTQNQRIAQAHAKVLDTLAGIPDEYGAVFVIDQEQHELAVAVREHHRRREEAEQLERMRGIARRRTTEGAFKREVRARVVDMQGRRVA